MSLFPDTDHRGWNSNNTDSFASPQDPRPPITITWNLWHGCSKKVSPGCLNCYMYHRDEEYGKDPTNVHKTANYNLPVRKYRSGPHKGLYRIPAGSTIYTCFTSDFFIDKADDWRPEAWDMMRQRPDCTFFMITKRPKRILQSLPEDWGDGWDHIHISCTCENQYWTDRRLPIFLKLPIRHKSITHEPMLEAIDIRKYLAEYGNVINPDGSRNLESVSCGGESGPKARICDYGWVVNSHIQCVEFSVPFHFHQTGAKLRKTIPDGQGGYIRKIFEIPREHQHEQARKAGLVYGGGIEEIPICLSTSENASPSYEPASRPSHTCPGKKISYDSDGM